jgi:hypothetical protein
MTMHSSLGDFRWDEVLGVEQVGGDFFNDLWFLLHGFGEVEEDASAARVEVVRGGRCAPIGEDVVAWVAIGGFAVVAHPGLWCNIFERCGLDSDLWS